MNSEFSRSLRRGESKLWIGRVRIDPGIICTYEGKDEEARADPQDHSGREVQSYSAKQTCPL